jgi:uncharacterized membrane protein YesL
MKLDPHRRTSFQKGWDFIQDISPYFIINLVWILFTVLLVTAIPAAAGLYYATNELAHGRTGGLETFFEGAKQYFWTSWKWGLPNLVIGFLFSVNFWFYSNITWQYAEYIRIVFYLMLFVWIAVNVYIFPYLIEQEKPKLRTAIRNSAVTFLRFPAQTIGLILLYVVLIWVGTFYIPPLWIVATGTVIAYTSNKMTIFALEKIGSSGIPGQKEAD